MNAEAKITAIVCMTVLVCVIAIVAGVTFIATQNNKFYYAAVQQCTATGGTFVPQEGSRSVCIPSHK